MSEVLHDAWRTASLGEFAEFKNGINFTKEEKGAVGVPTIDVKNMYGHGFAAGVEDLYRVNKAVNDDYFLKTGDLLFVRSSLKQEGIGWTSQFVSNSEPTTYCGFIIRARLKDQEMTDPSFLTFYFRSDDARRALIASSGKVAITNISQGILSKAPIPLPSLPEQKKIAHILSTVQRAIEAQERIIQTTTELKKALMHKLFTEGLRNEPQKQTEIGPVPESWAVLAFDKFVTLQRGYDLRKQDFRKGEVPVIGATQVIGYHDTSNVKAPGVTVVRSGSSAGKPQFIAEDFWAHNVLLYAKNFHGNVPKFVYYKILALDLTQYRQGVAVPTLNRNTFSAIEVSVPSPEDQQQIADALDSVENKTAVAERKKAQLQDLFRTLLHELMTAKTRVHELNFEMTP